MQRERRRDPYPWTWEIPLGVAVLVLVVLTSAVQLGRGLANLLVGAGWTWPSAAEAAHNSGPGPGPGLFGSPVASSFWTSLPGVVSGNATAGLNPAPVRAAGAPLLWCSLAVIELVAIAALASAAIVVLRRWGPGRMKGMASVTEAEALLGVTRLGRVRSIVRPDLYDDGSSGRQHEHAPSEPPGGAGAARRPRPSKRALRLQLARRLIGSPTSTRAGRAVDLREPTGTSVGPSPTTALSPWVLSGRVATSGPLTTGSDAPDVRGSRNVGEWQ